MKAKIKWNEQKSRYELSAHGKVLVRSKHLGYLEFLVNEKKHKRLVAAKVTEAEVVSRAPAAVRVMDQDGNDLAKPSQFSIDERFEFIDEMISMVVNKSAAAVLITGEGGVGKTHSVIKNLAKAGKVDVAKLIPTVDSLLTEQDTDEEMDEKVAAQMSRQTGDYVVVKGYATAPALYRILFENRSRLIVFDDCDSVLRDATALALLKSALDKYEERWISWRTESVKESDLPTTFKFTGSVIFISNLPLTKIDEAVRTRCLKVDVSMTKEQRIERMTSVLDQVMPHVDLDVKQDALSLMKEHLAACKSVNFRTLMDLISIRNDPNVRDWRKLGQFTMAEG